MVTIGSAQAGATAARTNYQAINRTPLTAVQNANEELENYQGRVALALGIDTVRRTLDVTNIHSQSYCKSLFRGPYSQLTDDNSWAGCNWSTSNSSLSL